MTWTAPPAAGIFFSFPSAKKAIQRLSGDHMGSWASSVPASWRALTRSMDRSHNVGLAPRASALNTKAWPSGERANDGTLTVVLIAPEKAVFSGGKTGNADRVTRRRGDRRPRGKEQRRAQEQCSGDPRTPLAVVSDGYHHRCRTHGIVQPLFNLEPPVGDVVKSLRRILPETPRDDRLNGWRAFRVASPASRARS